MISELQFSWEQYQKSKSVVRKVQEVVNGNIEDNIRALLSFFQDKRKKLESELLETINFIPSRTSSAFRMRKAANLQPVATARDLAKLFLNPTYLRHFNPFLVKETKEKVFKCISIWLQYCVFEDELERMNYFAMEKNRQGLLGELREVGRSWDASDYPEWLVFEVEQRLQIRGIQSTVAQYLIKNPGAITQLNMGEGKTRVILPMLVLSMANPDSLIRLHFLPQLLGEVVEYLHRSLTASLSGRKLFALPFQRDVELSDIDALKILDNLQRCKDSRGAICVAPEHRLSLELKRHELRSANKDNICNLLDKISAFPYVDIIDESDEILRNSFQLIYAVGSCLPLPDGKDRWVACQAVLWQLQSNQAVAETLKFQTQVGVYLY